MRRGSLAISFTLWVMVSAFPARSTAVAETEGIGLWDPDGLAAQISGMPPILGDPLEGGICADGDHCKQPAMSPVEAQRRQAYDRMYSFGAASVPALARLLQSENVTAKRNALLALGVLAGGWYFANRSPSRIDISAALPALAVALGDSDPTVRAWAAQTIGDAGLVAAQLVPQVAALLNDPDEGVRNSACIGLKGIGPLQAEHCQLSNVLLWIRIKTYVSLQGLRLVRSEGFHRP